MLKGIMFDMDNTILYSRINFKRMRDELVTYFTESHQLPQSLFREVETPAVVIEVGKKAIIQQKYPDSVEHEGLVWQNNKDFQAIDTAIWSLVKEIEVEGMIGAQLAPDSKETLRKLKELGYAVTIVTNNAYASAKLALEETELYHQFDLLVSRDQMKALKPAPDGLLYTRSKLEHIQEWLMVGDSWIDGKAAEQAQIPFIAYQGEQQEMEKHAVPVQAYVTSFHELEEWIKRYF